MTVVYLNRGTFHVISSVHTYQVLFHTCTPPAAVKDTPLYFTTPHLSSKNVVNKSLPIENSTWRTWRAMGKTGRRRPSRAAPSGGGALMRGTAAGEGPARPADARPQSGEAVATRHVFVYRV